MTGTNVEALSREQLEAEVLRLRKDRDCDVGTAFGRPMVSTPASRQELVAAIEKTRMPMIMTDPNLPDDPIIFANRAFQELSGYASSELVGRNCRFLQGPDTDPDQLERIRAALRAKQDIAVDILNYRRDGTPFLNELYISPVFGPDGVVLYHFASQLDVTGYREDRRQLESGERRHRAVFDSAVDFGIVVTDVDGVVTDWNTGATAIFGWTRDEMRGQPAARIFTQRDRDDGRVRTEMHLAFTEGRAVDERWHIRKDGSEFWASGKMMPLLDGDAHLGFTKILRDRTEQRDAAARQQADAEFMRSVLASSADCIKVLDLDAKLTFMNEGGMGVMEISDFNAVRGCPWPDFWQGQGNLDALAALDAARSGGIGHFQGAADTYLGTPKWWDVQVTPIFGADGAPSKLLAVSRDISDLKAVQSDLATSEARWRGLFSTMQEGFFLGEIVRDAEGGAFDVRFLAVNPSFETQSGLPANSTAGRTVREVIPTIPQWLIDAYADVVDTGRPATFEVAVPALDRVFEARANREEGQRLAVLFFDITDRKRTEERRSAMIDLGDRLRDVTLLSEIGPITADILARALGLSHAGYGVADPVRETVTIDHDRTAVGAASLVGVHAFRDYGSYIDDLKVGGSVFITDALDDPRTSEGSAALVALGVRSIANLPLMEHGRFVALFFALKAEPHAWTEEEKSFLQNVADRTRAAIARLEAEERQRVLNLELSHRMKNMLAMVLSIATQTLRSVPDKAPVEAFEQRIHALSSAHDVLLAQEWTSAPLEAVADAVLGNFVQSTRVRFTGPEVSLGPRATLSVSLLLHELATNAAKYGALSNDEGRVGISWRVDGDADEGDLVLDWEESGGPPVEEPARRGFGSRLIRMGLVGTGDVDLRYPPSGFQAEMRAPLTQINQS